MTGVDTYLATLREALHAEEDGFCAWCQCSVYEQPHASECEGRRALAIVDRVEAELARLREERDALQAESIRYGGNIFRAKYLAAEARCARLQQALAMLWQHYLLPISDEQKRQVEEALAAPDTPADSQPEEPT